LTDGFLFPHLIVPVDSSKANTALGNSYNGAVSKTVSSLFNFDIPPVSSGKTCSIVLLLPKEKPFSLRGKGGITISQVQPATNDTTYADVAAESGKEKTLGSVKSIEAGGAYIFSTSSCKEIAGNAVGILFSAVDGAKSGLSLSWFQDSGAPAVGLYMNVC
jgi:hypothetical protein